MDMVRHEAVGVDAAAERGFPFREVREVVLKVFLSVKDRPAIMTALDDVMRPVGEHQTRLPSNEAQSAGSV